MIVPSIDLIDNNAVQLVEGKHHAINAGDPLPIAQRFARVGEIAVIDLDAALARGSNAKTIKEILKVAPCRVGGGIRSAEDAIRWLDAGASKVILGTAATPEILSQLPRERVVAALDARNNNVVVEGWTKQTTNTVETQIETLRPYVSGFLVTFVEREGRMTGLPIERVKQLARLARDRQLTVAGGVRTTADIANADRAGVDAQVGMALYTGTIPLADALAAPLHSDRTDGLWPTIVTDEQQRTLGLAYSNLQSLHASIETGQATYYSRSRAQLWRKGESSGNTQQLLRVETDCDRDTLRFIVKQSGTGFCHRKTTTCFANGTQSGLARLDATIADRLHTAPPNSYTRRLLDDPAMLRSKLIEESNELIEASTPDHAAEEAADVMYFALTAARARGASLVDIERALDNRALRVTRRPGNAKEAIR